MKYCLTENEPGRTLHGGIDTANEQYWETSVDRENNQVTFGITLRMVSMDFLVMYVF